MRFVRITAASPRVMEESGDILPSSEFIIPALVREYTDEAAQAGISEESEKLGVTVGVARSRILPSITAASDRVIGLLHSK